MMKTEADRTSAGDLGGGLSRAAMKRAKKKKRSLIDSASIALKGSASNDNVDKSDSSTAVGLSKSTSHTIAYDSTDRKRLKTSEKDLLSSTSHGVLKSVDHGNSDAEHKSHQNETHLSFREASIDADFQSLHNSSLVEILRLDEVKDASNKDHLESVTAEQRAACLLQAMIHPTSLNEFYEDYWEKKPLLVRASDTNKRRFRDLLSLEGIKAMTKNYSLYYGVDLNVTKYKMGSDGVKRRITLDKLSGKGDRNNTNRKEGEENSNDEAVVVDTAELWSNYNDGCTIRLLRPHKLNDAVQALLSTLEMEFQCMVGANAYLTPPLFSQGFAPHYDDIEAFCLQLQGRKRWKVYEPTTELPRTSSKDFTSQDLEDKKPTLDITLEEGDILYMPRGWIHQACTLENSNEHSLHLTVSTMQQWAWVDLMEIVLPEALQASATSESSASLRQGLPRGFMDCMGVMHEETKNDLFPDSLKVIVEDESTNDSRTKRKGLFREKFRQEAKKRIMAVAKAALDMLDASCDELAKRYISERQPPALTANEALSTSGGSGADIAITPMTQCRLVRPGVGRLVLEDDNAVVYHCADNSREYLGNPVSPLTFEMDDGPALEQLLTTVEPNWILVNDLFHDTIEDKIAIAQALYDEGILSIKEEE
jgi:lysine-specific demethylase/histidyl-hydroxylase NO66